MTGPESPRKSRGIPFLLRRRGTIVTAFIICYALTSFVAGYVSGGFYSRSDGKHWIKSMLLTASLFPFASFAIGFLLNTVAIFYHSLAAIPFGTMVSLASILLGRCDFLVPLFDVQF